MTTGACGQRVASRWDLEIRGPATQENGDLRFQGDSGRLLLQHDDSAFQRLQNLTIAAGHISFSLRSGRRFEGTVTDTMMAGTVREPGGVAQPWFALPLGPHSLVWPVPPRVTMRQLAMGTPAVTERVPGAWMSALPAVTQLEREYQAFAASAQVSAMEGEDRAVRSRRFALGLLPDARLASATLLGRIAETITGWSDVRGTESRATFVNSFAGLKGWNVDIHDVMIGRAGHYLVNFQLANAVIGLQELGELVQGADSSAIRESGWRLWCLAASDSAAVYARIDTLARRDPIAGNSVRALLNGYQEATDWWRRAVEWLLTTPWLTTASGPRSPHQLMNEFWGDSLPLPPIAIRPFGDVAAMPIVSATHLGPSLARPRNASAAEWLAVDGMKQALDIWLPIRWGEPALTVVIGGRIATMVSPAAQAMARPAAFFGRGDRIVIDPGIMPIVAVATFLHEWHHLIAAQRRLGGLHPAALVRGEAQLQLQENDPWVAEGFAEWATEETLRPAGKSAALLMYTQAEKRLAARDSTDPHLLGYRLVRAAALRIPNRSLLRDRLVAHLHDLPGLAGILGLGGAGRLPGATLHRPANASIIPEISFTWDEGTAFDVTRRLVIPNTRPEH